MHVPTCVRCLENTGSRSYCEWPYACQKNIGSRSYCEWPLSLRSLLLRLAAVIGYRWVLKYKLLVQFFGPIFRSKKILKKKIQIWVASVWYIVANFCPNWAIYKNGAPGAFLDKLKIRWRITTAIFCEELNAYSVNIWVIFSNYNSHDVYSVCANSL